MRIAECGMRSPTGSGHPLRGSAPRGNSSFRRSASFCSFLLCILPISLDIRADEKSPPFTTETLRGRVVYLAEDMEKQTGVPAVPEARDRVLALKTDSGLLVPLLEDIRARAFRRDDRLRAMQVELLVRRYATSPFVQIIRVFEIAKDGLYEIDYWCEVCSIAMFEKKDCECCQAETELRRRPVGQASSLP